MLVVKHDWSESMGYPESENLSTLCDRKRWLLWIYFVAAVICIKFMKGQSLLSCNNVIQ